MIDPRARLAAGGLVGVPGAQRRTFQRNGFLFSAECAAEAGYLVRTGQVRCFLLDADGRETTTAILGPGQFVGLAAVVGHQAHQQFCQALTQVEAWSLPADELRRFCANSQLIQGWLLGSLGRRLELALTLRRGTSLLSAAERADDIHVRLRALAGLDPREVRQSSLASLLQIRPETLARARRSQHRPAWMRPAGQQIIGIGRHDFGAHQSVLNGDLPDGCIGSVVSGRVELSVTASGSRAVVVETLERGDVFGFGSLLDLPAVPYSIVGLTEGAILVTPGGEFLRELAASRSTSGQPVIRLAERLEVLERQLARAALPHIGDRLAHVLREVATSNGVAAGDRAPYIPASWSHVALARHLGVCRETVTRSLATLVKAGVIARQGRRILMVSAGGRTAARLELPDHEPSVETASVVTGIGGQKREAPPPRAASSDRNRRATHRLGAHTARARSRQSNKCRLCGLRAPGTLCPGCADRLERDLERNQNQACPNCGRHRELCQTMPCKPDSAARRSPSSNTPTSKVELIPTESIDEPSAARSSRRRYADRSIHELAASLRHEGLLQPICVRRKGTRFELIFGMRRFRAALEAGLTEVPCTVREADDDRALLLNALENLHREQLSNVERVKTIERLAASGLGVREISRRTGFNASTISRWLRINRRPELKKALEDNRLDIARAVILVDAPAPAVSSLIQQAPTISAAELRRRVAAIKTGSQKAIENDRCHLANALRSLRAVRSNVNEPLMVESLQKEIDRISGARGLAALTRIGSEQPRIQRA